MTEQQAYLILQTVRSMTESQIFSMKKSEFDQLVDQLGEAIYWFDKNGQMEICLELCELEAPFTNRQMIGR